MAGGYNTRQKGESVMRKRKRYNREFQIQACRLLVEQGYFKNIEIFSLIEKSQYG